MKVFATAIASGGTVTSVQLMTPPEVEEWLAETVLPLTVKAAIDPENCARQRTAGPEMLRRLLE
jgi:hypothetical protein